MLERALADYQSVASRQLLETWLQYVEDDAFIERVATMHEQPELSLDDIVGLQLQVNRTLMEAYRTLAREADTDEAAEVFRKLLELEESHSHRLAKAATATMDM